jgi:large subunit ribosomal protein L6
MSRVGKNPVPVPANVKVTHDYDTLLVEGPKGKLKQYIHPEFKLDLNAGNVVVLRPDDSKRNRALHGLYRSLLNNMVTGVSTGFETTLEFIGVGYRADVKGNQLEFSVGYSHTVIMVLPEGITGEAKNEKGQPPRVTLRSFDKQLLGQVVAKVRSIRSPEPYKGKGIRIAGEFIRRKAGKSGGKK